MLVEHQVGRSKRFIARKTIAELAPSEQSTSEDVCIKARQALEPVKDI
jgi:hypothetical protein